MRSGVEFWDWAIAAYERPGLEAALLELQDAHQQSVPFLLWAAWMAASDRNPAPALLAEGARLAREWEDAVVGPLRQVRRHLKAAGLQSLRSQIKSCELEAERALMEALAGLAPPAAGAGVGENALVQAGAHWNPSPSADALKLLARVLG